jgi:SOS response regulatory protein OraA/RecX
MARVEDTFVSIDVVNQRFDEAYDRVENLTSFIAEEARKGADVRALKLELAQAEAQKKAILETLRNARHRKSIPIAAVKRDGLNLWRA